MVVVIKEYMKVEGNFFSEYLCGCEREYTVIKSVHMGREGGYEVKGY